MRRAAAEALMERAVSASLCSDAASEECVLANAFRPGRLSFERASVKGRLAHNRRRRECPAAVAHNTASPENLRDWRIDR